MEQYVSCKFIENGFTLWPDNTATACCMNIYSRSVDKFTIRLRPDSDSFDFKEWQILRTGIQERLKQGIVPTECQSCIFLQKGQWDKQFRRFAFINVINSRRCNLACNFCYLSSDFKLANETFNSHMGLFKDMARQGLIGEGTMIFWGGGEPALHPNLAELYALFKSCGCRQHFDTNATVYIDFLYEELRTGHATASCSLMSPDQDTYNKIMGKDICTRAWENAGRYAASGGDVRAKFILLPENSGQEEAFIRRCKATGIQIVTVDLEIYQGLPEAHLQATRLARFTRCAASYGIDLLYGVGVVYAGETFQQAFLNEMRKLEIKDTHIMQVQHMHICISVVGKSVKAQDSQCFFLSVCSDISPRTNMHELEITRDNAWEINQYSYFNNEFSYTTSLLNHSLEFDVKYADRIALRFISHPWSGIIKVITDHGGGGGEHVLDLYCINHSFLEIDLLTGKHTRTNRIF
jgi:MoaA/NifB/PqqE/SkfB family radical SAM enzyme